MVPHRASDRKGPIAAFRIRGSTEIARCYASGEVYPWPGQGKDK
jgi:hypothetical protein